MTPIEWVLYLCISGSCVLHDTARDLQECLFKGVGVWAEMSTARAGREVDTRGSIVDRSWITCAPRYGKLGKR